ncbi:MAG: HAD family hydrolase [Bacteroidota bacterium]
MKYKCILFDCDGVLVDSEEIANRVLVEMANEVGAEMDLQYAFDHFVGKSMSDCYDQIAQLISQPLPAQFDEEYRERSFQAFRSELKPIKGIHEVLDKLTVPFCVASSGPIEKIRLNLTTTDLIEKFEGKIFSCYEIGKWKPDPAIFLHAAKVMGFDPVDCVVIEDSLSGVKAARKGGFEVFAYTNPKKKEVFEQEGANVFYEMKNLMELLREAKAHAS